MNRSPLPRLTTAFTLIELLVVIAIIAVLAGLLLPVLSRIQESANSTKCTANLKEIGTAINAYATDADGLLPGPLDIWQLPYTAPPASGQYPDAGSEETEAADRQLSRRLGKYLPTPKNTTPNERNSVFVCPSFARQVPLLDAPDYVLNPRPIAELSAPPFGDPDQNKKPVKKSQLTAWNDLDNTAEGDRTVNLAITWALKDADTQAFTNVKYTAPPPNSATLPTTPVHRDHRNALFYDWHVGKLDAELARNDKLK